MNFAKLFASGTSLGGGLAGGRYRVNKRVQLPKFGSPKNPFATGKRPEPQPEREVTLIAPEPVQLTDLKSLNNAPSLLAREKFVATKIAVTRIVKSAGQVPRLVGAQAVRMGPGLKKWAARMNPMSLLARRRGPVRASVDTFRPPVVQTEMSLDAVKVVRNDLSDADLEVVLVTKPMTPNQSEQLIMASAGGRVPVGAINRLSSWMFGAKSS